jgi:hypothetical protein
MSTTPAKAAPAGPSYSNPLAFKGRLESAWLSNGNDLNLRVRDSVSDAVVVELTIPADTLVAVLAARNSETTPYADVEFFGTRNIGKVRQHQVMAIRLAGYGETALAAVLDVNEPALAAAGWGYVSRKWNLHNWDQASQSYRVGIVRFVEPGTPMKVPATPVQMLAAGQQATVPKANRPDRPKGTSGKRKNGPTKPGTTLGSKAINRAAAKALASVQPAVPAAQRALSRPRATGGV